MYDILMKFSKNEIFFFTFLSISFQNEEKKYIIHEYWSENMEKKHINLYFNSILGEINRYVFYSYTTDLSDSMQTRLIFTRN